MYKSQQFVRGVSYASLNCNQKILFILCSPGQPANIPPARLRDLDQHGRTQSCHKPVDKDPWGYLWPSVSWGGYRISDLTLNLKRAAVFFLFYFIYYCFWSLPLLLLFSIIVRVCIGQIRCQYEKKTRKFHLSLWSSPGSILFQK